MKTVSIIRNRGQLTIPDSIRQIVSWITPMSTISISVIKPDEIVIRPHTHHLDNNKIWKLVKRSRAIKGKGKGSAAQFLAEDRQSH